jgi:hypothetical protein
MTSDAHRRSSPDAEEFEFDREVTPSSHRRRRPNFIHSSSDSAANNVNDILSVIQTGPAESRRQFEDGWGEIRNGQM